MPKVRLLKIIAWHLAGLVSIIAVVRWSQVRLSDGELGPYELFPLLGLVAFSLMWTHYVTDAIRRLAGLDKAVLRNYFNLTAWVVLFLILLHPGILYLNLWLDGFGLPPFSTFNLYIGQASRIALLLGVISLFIFLAFELHRKYKTASWWKYVEYANLAAMAAIFYHALTLGGEVTSGWYQAVWVFYGVTFLAAAVYTYRNKFRQRGGA